jgi:DNA-binding MarR family transcriptional regulator
MDWTDRTPHEVTEPTDTALHELVIEVRRLFHALREHGERLHADDELSAGQRALLLNLHQLGPRTVPQLARLRPVSRQHIQTLVDPLLTRGLVERRDNPQHRRSHLMALTAAGRRVVRRIRAREAGPMASASTALGNRRLQQATNVLRDVRTVLARELASGQQEETT